MRFAAWVLCWPLLGLFGVAGFVADSMIDACEWLDRVLERLEDYVDSEGA